MEDFSGIEIKYTNCCVCCDNFNYDNIVYYKINNIWSQYLFCSICTVYMIESKWLGYIEQIKKSDCEKELKSLLSKKIPFNLTIDGTKNTQEIDEFYWNNKFYSSELKKPMHINSHINSHDILDELSQKLKQVYLTMINNSTFDYLEEIKIIMNEFDL
jgi:hypothetical protein